MTGLMMSVHKRRKQPKEHLKGSKGQRKKILNTGKCMLAKEKNTSKEENPVRLGKNSKTETVNK